MVQTSKKILKMVKKGRKLSKESKIVRNVLNWLKAVKTFNFFFNWSKTVSKKVFF